MGDVTNEAFDGLASQAREARERAAKRAEGIPGDAAAAIIRKALEGNSLTTAGRSPQEMAKRAKDALRGGEQGKRPDLGCRRPQAGTPR